ncbi:hypothetical protein [Kitasatospora griseola]|uniref:hypothetical protein n=1 Tax=Kitasatospora griseola TaxID=2064 RepID=UPI0038222F1B
MTTTSFRPMDGPRGLPADPGWADSAQHLDQLLEAVAFAAQRQPGDAWVLHPAARWDAADALAPAVDAATPPPSGHRSPTSTGPSAGRGSCELPRPTPMSDTLTGRQGIPGDRRGIHQG